MDIANLSTEELRTLKQQITKELSKRHKALEDEKCNCWTCHHCFYDENAHTSFPKGNRGEYKCMAWGKKGKIIPTKHKAPVWCPTKNGQYEPTVADVFNSLPNKEKETMCKEIAAAMTIGEIWESIDYTYRTILDGYIEKIGNKEFVSESTIRTVRHLLDNVLSEEQKRVVYFKVGKACEKWKGKGE